MAAKPSKTVAPPEAPQIVLRPLDGLVAYARNSRTHSPESTESLKASLVEFGFTNPVLADARGIVAGHGRCMAARQLYDAGISLRFPNGFPIPDGMVPVVDCTGWSDAQRRAYVIQDNQSALNSGWDMEMLKVELDGLKADGFDLELTGFSLGQIEGMSFIAVKEESVADAGGDDELTIKVKCYRDSEQTVRRVLKDAIAAAGLAGDVAIT